MKGKIKKILYLVLALLLLTVGAYFASVLTKNLQVKEFTQNLGVWGYLFLLLGITIGGIIVPISCLPFLLAGLSLYNFWLIFILYYLGNTIIAPVVDYWIARKFGRPAVIKLAGKKSIKEIDKLADVVGIKALAVLRLFGGILFDSISYAMGLTNISFKNYFILTSILPIPGMILTLYFIDRGLTQNPLYLGVIVVWGYLAGALTLYFVYKKSKSKEVLV